MLALDAYLELRANAVRRFWRSANGRSPGPDLRSMPAQLRRHHVLSLRTIDARQHGASYREIAEILFGFRGTKDDWDNDPRKSQVRRLVLHGTMMMNGSYRHLLHYPLKPPTIPKAPGVVIR